MEIVKKYTAYDIRINHAIENNKTFVEAIDYYDALIEIQSLKMRLNKFESVTK